MVGYCLIDFGGGRKLESLGGYLIDRPSPAARSAPRLEPQSRWQTADAVYLVEKRRWQLRRPWPEGLVFRSGRVQLPLRPTPFGHIGCFPEQAPHWRWLAEQVAEVAERSPTQAPQGLNLFAHTGGSTMALAAAGAEVTHIDAAKPSVTAARLAARAVACDDSIRFIVEDAAKFVSRELRRGRSYDVIVLDPPSYGHGPGGKAWRIQRDLWPLLHDCLRLLRPATGAMLVTGHSEGIDQKVITRELRQRVNSVDRERLRLSGGRSQLTDSAGRRLDAGFYVRLEWR